MTLKFLRFFFPLAFVFCFTAKSQITNGTYPSYFKEGNYLLLEDNYDLALKNFLAAYRLDSSSANINFNVGYCYLKSSFNKAKAESYLGLAVQDVKKTYRQDDPTEKAAPPTAIFYYAQALHINYKFDEAIAQYDRFEELAKPLDKGTKGVVDHLRQQSVYAKEMIQAPVNVQITNLGDSINSEFPEYSAVLSADERTIIYTTRRPSSTGGEMTPDGRYYEDIVIAYKDDKGIWHKPGPVSSFINSNSHEASVSLTPDGQTLIIYKSVSATDGDLFYSTWTGKNWTSPQKFESNINSKYWEPSACLSADGNTLYFVSNRPGGYGGRDLYRCVRLPNGKWSLAQNLGPEVNTPYDEESPFLHPDGLTLFFSSDGHKSMGGFDILFSIMDEDKKFSEPINMGYPINTPDDDLFYVTSPDGKRGYYASAKEGGLGEKDIYLISIVEARERPLALFKGSIQPSNGETIPEDIGIVVTDKESGDLIGTYRPKGNGTFTTILPPNHTYNFSYQVNGEEFYKEDLYVSNDLSYQEINKEVDLEPVSLGGKVTVKNKGLQLNIIILNNPQQKLPVGGAKLTLSSSAGTQDFGTDVSGKKDGIALAPETDYTLRASSGTKTSAPLSLSTKGVKATRLYTEVLYLEEKSSNALLNLTVTDAKTGKPMANQKVIITGADSSVQLLKTDAKGQLLRVGLNPDVDYVISTATDVDAVTGNESLMAITPKAGKTYNKTLAHVFADAPHLAADARPMLQLTAFDGTPLRQPLANAGVVARGSDGSLIETKTDSKGQVTDLALNPNVRYTLEVNCSAESKTVGVKTRFLAKPGVTYRKTVYLDNEKCKANSTAPSEAGDNAALSLNVRVQDMKTSKALDGIAVTLKGNDGSVTELKTDENGKIKNITLNPNVNYELYASCGTVVSEKELFTTLNSKKSKIYKKTLLLNSADCGSAGHAAPGYVFYFKYNATEISDNDPSWLRFIDTVATLSKTQKVTILIESSASKVPTHKYGDNQELAKDRANHTADKIAKAVNSRGGNSAQLSFDKQFSVNGPDYRGDWDVSRKKYEKYQFVRIGLR